MKRSSLCLVLLLGCVLLTAPGILAAGDQIGHKVVEGDSIRSLLLQYNKLNSMQEYFRAREAFSRLNPAVFHSALLAPGATVEVPVLDRRTAPGGLTFQEQRIVRVEFESAPGAEKVLVYLDGPVLPDVFTLKESDPLRVVCDFDGALPAQGLVRELDPQGRLIGRIRVGHEDKPFRRARVVAEIDRKQTGRIEQEFYEQESLFVLVVHQASDK